LYFVEIKTFSFSIFPVLPNILFGESNHHLSLNAKGGCHEEESDLPVFDSLLAVFGKRFGSNNNVAPTM
jgi:hypothetical protein